MDLRGKVVVVTGAGGPGCGRAVSCAFAREGAHVVASDVNDESGRRTLRKIHEITGNAGPEAAYVHCDVRQETEVRGLIEFAERKFGGVHVVVNNASAPYTPGEALDNWDDTVRTDLLGAMYGTRLGIQALRRSGGGAIVNVTSTSAIEHGRTRPSGSPSYDAAKAGIMRLTTMLAWLGEKENIRVNCIAPDWVATPEVKSYVDSLTPEQRAKDGVPSRLTGLDEIAAQFVRLATDETLAGRVLVWWSDDAPRLIPWADPGYTRLE